MADSGEHAQAKSGISDTDSDHNPANLERENSGHPKASRKTKAGRLPNDVQMGEIQEFFYLPIEAAASKMGIGLTTLKKLCRQYGMPRWPYRKFQQLIRIACMAKNGFGVSSVDYVQFMELLRELNVPPESSLWDHVDDDNSKVLIRDVLQQCDFWKDKKRKGKTMCGDDEGRVKLRSSAEEGAHEDEDDGHLSSPATKLLNAIQQTGLYRLQEPPMSQYDSNPAARYVGTDSNPLWNKLANDSGASLDKEASLSMISGLDRSRLLLDPVDRIQQQISKASGYQLEGNSLRFNRSDPSTLKRQAELVDALRREGSQDVFSSLRKEGSRDVFSNITGDSVLDALRREGSYDIFSSLKSLEGSRDVLGALRKEPSRDFLSPLRKEASRDVFGALRQEGSQDMLGSLYSENSRNFLSLPQESSLDMQCTPMWKAGSQDVFSALRSEPNRDILGSLIKESSGMGSMAGQVAANNPFQTPDNSWNQGAVKLDDAKLGLYTEGSSGGQTASARDMVDDPRPVRSVHFASPNARENSTLKQLYAALEQHRSGSGSWSGQNPAQRLSGMELSTMREMQRQLSDESTNSHLPASIRNATTAFRPYKTVLGQSAQWQGGIGRGDRTPPMSVSEPGAMGPPEPVKIGQDLSDLHNILGQLYRTGQSDLALQHLLDQSRMP